MLIGVPDPLFAEAGVEDICRRRSLGALAGRSPLIIDLNSMHGKPPPFDPTLFDQAEYQPDHQAEAVEAKLCLTCTSRYVERPTQTVLQRKDPFN